VAKQSIDRPGQIGDLRDKLRLDPGEAPQWPTYAITRTARPGQ
jgi:hypothetical protein